MVDKRQAPLRTAELWKPPLKGWYKVNWAVCMDPLSKVWGSSVLVRDHVGRVMAAKVNQ